MNEMETTEIVENIISGTEVSSEESSTEVLVEASPDTPYLEKIYHDVHIIMIFVIITFCSACLRSWRINSLRGC